MSVAISIDYRGELRCQASHGPSGVELVTDAPVDNHGKGESFSPTDLVATALGTCVATILAIVGERHGLALRGTSVEVRKEMVADPKRRIAALPMTIRVPIDCDADTRKMLERAAAACPVCNSLDPRIEHPIEWIWGAVPAPRS